jgi:transposase
MSDLNQSYAAFDQASAVVCVIELSRNSWLLAGTARGLKRQPCKKLSTNPHEWRGEAEKAGHEIKRIVAAFEAGRDGFWLALVHALRSGRCKSLFESLKTWQMRIADL